MEATQRSIDIKTQRQSSRACRSCRTPNGGNPAQPQSVRAVAQQKNPWILPGMKKIGRACLPGIPRPSQNDSGGKPHYL